MQSPFIYITRGQMPEDFEVKRKEWHRRKHAPDVVGLGFLSARAYSSKTTPQNCNVYEIADLALFDDPAYMAMRKADTFVPTVMKSFTYHSASFYRQAIVLDRDGKSLSPAPTLHGRALSLLYFGHDDEARVHAWFRNVVTKGDNDEVLTFRLWDQTRAHPLEPPKESRWIAAIAWSVPGPRDGSRLEHAAAQLPWAEVARAELVVKWYGLMEEFAFEA